jgi:hypothetical protein
MSDKQEKTKYSMRYNEFGVDVKDQPELFSNPKIIENSDDLPEIKHVDREKISVVKTSSKKSEAARAPMKLESLPDLDTFLSKKFMKKYFD